MNFCKKEGLEKSRKIGELTGFVVMYIIFTTILYFFLKILDKIPDSWNFFYIMNITLFIILVGSLIRLYLR